MSELTAITDEELTAYLDGEVDEALRTRIDEALATDADLGRQLEALRFDKDALLREADRLLAEAPAFPKVAANQSQAPRGLALAASLVLGLALGAGGLSLWSPEPQLDDWRDFAAAYHALYTPETVAPLNASEADRAEQLGRVSSALGLTLDDASNHGLTFRRAQVLGFEDHPIAHLAYSTADGIPVAYCITRAAGPVRAPEFRIRQGIAAMEWSDGAHQFILIGKLPEAEMTAMASAFFGQS